MLRFASIVTFCGVTDDNDNDHDNDNDNDNDNDDNRFPKIHFPFLKS